VPTDPLSRVFYVYVIFHPTGTPCYVGKGRGKRWKSHARGDSHNSVLKRMIQRFGASLPVAVIRDGLTEAEAFETEVALIAAIGRADICTGSLLNKTDGGEGVSGFVFTVDHRKRLSDSHAGQTPSPANRKAVSLATKGKPRPQSVIDAMREKATAWAQSDVGRAWHAKRVAHFMSLVGPDERFPSGSRRTNLTPPDVKTTSERRSYSLKKYYSGVSAEVRAEKYGKSRRGKSSPTRGIPRTEAERHRIVAGLANMSDEAEASRRSKISVTLRGYHWITNGLGNRRLMRGDILPEGWRYGKCRTDLKERSTPD
jgi:hypothetical protein